MQKKMENKTQQFKISDFYQAIILKTCGLQLVDLERGSGKFVTFVFNDPELQAKEIISKYWDRQIEVEARELIENINEIKTRIYSKS